MLSISDAMMRRSYLGGSDVAPLMTGDVERLIDVWKVKTGEAGHRDLDNVWPVRLGQCTEPLNREWFTRKTGLQVTRVDELVMHHTFKWAGATLDGWVEDPGHDRTGGGYPVELKHCGGREPLQVIIDRYYPQCHWQMFVTQSSQCALSVILAANPPAITMIEYNSDYMRTLLERANTFWHCVRNRIPPVPPEPEPPPWDGMREELIDNEEWRRSAYTWLQSHGAAEAAEDNAKILKSMVPKDVRKAYGHGVCITRSRDNRLYLREMKDG